MEQTFLLISVHETNTDFILFQADYKGNVPAIPTKRVANGASNGKNRADLRNCQLQKRQSAKKDYLAPKLKVNGKNNSGDDVGDGNSSHFPNESGNNSYNSGSSSEVDDSNNTETHMMLLQQKQLCSTSNNSQTFYGVDALHQSSEDQIVKVEKENNDVNKRNIENIECNSESQHSDGLSKVTRSCESKTEVTTKTSVLLNINR